MFALAGAQGRSPTGSVVPAIAVASFVPAALWLSRGTSVIVVFTPLGTAYASLVPVRIYRPLHVGAARLLRVRFYSAPGRFR